jgi:hypothetical protein
MSLPDSVTIEVVEETPEKGYLVIPVDRAALSDEQLDAAEVAGGYDALGGSI